MSRPSPRNTGLSSTCALMARSLSWTCLRRWQRSVATYCRRARSTARQGTPRVPAALASTAWILSFCKPGWPILRNRAAAPPGDRPPPRRTPRARGSPARPPPHPGSAWDSPGTREAGLAATTIPGHHRRSHSAPARPRPASLAPDGETRPAGQRSPRDGASRRSRIPSDLHPAARPRSRPWPRRPRQRSARLGSVVIRGPSSRSCTRCFQTRDSLSHWLITPC